MQNLKLVGGTVIELHFFNQIKEEEEREHGTIDENYFNEYLTHTGLIFVVIFTLVLNSIETESENWNFLKSMVE